MQIREATINDTEVVKNIHLHAFDNSEAETVANLAVNLLSENSPIKIISLVAIVNKEIVGHVAFSPVFLNSTNEHFGYILAPLAVSPVYQNNKIGSAIVKHGLDTISSSKMEHLLSLFMVTLIIILGLALILTLHLNTIPLMHFSTQKVGTLSN